MSLSQRLEDVFLQPTTWLLRCNMTSSSNSRRTRGKGAYGRCYRRSGRGYGGDNFLWV